MRNQPREACTAMDRAAIAYEDALRLETSDQAATPDAFHDAHELAAVLGRALLTLGPLEERVLRLVHGIGLPSQSTIAEIAAMLGAAEEDVKAVAQRARRKMMHPSRSQRLRDWLTAC